MTIHVCGSDGQPVGEFEEADFRDRIFAGQLLPDCFYWHEGMEDWRPLADYRALAKTQRLVFTAPMTRTIKIDMNAASAGDAAPPPRPQSSLARLWQRITGKGNA